MKLQRNFYERDTITVAKDLLGKHLVHCDQGFIYSGRIVETEAYLGITDPACHTYQGKRTKRIQVMWGPAGYSYVYFTYGLHYCLNVVTVANGVPEAVLIRAVEPKAGMERMYQNRYGEIYDVNNKLKIKNLTNGPAKLAQAFGIDKTMNGEDLCANRLYILELETNNTPIVTTTRIGIRSGCDLPYRFYLEGNPNISKK